MQGDDNREYEPKVRVLVNQSEQCTTWSSATFWPLAWGLSSLHRTGAGTTTSLESSANFVECSECSKVRDDLLDS